MNDEANMECINCRFCKVSDDISYTLICKHHEIQKRIVVPRLRDQSAILDAMSCENLNPDSDCEFFTDG